MIHEDRATVDAVASTVGGPGGPDIALVRWPAEDAVRRSLAGAGRPRLLLVGDGIAPPVTADELEDWVRLPAEPDEVELRLTTLALRARGVAAGRALPVLDDDGILRAGDAWAGVPPLEARVLGLLLAAPRSVVPRADLEKVVWPDGLPADPRALDGVVKRLRRRVRPLGLQVHTATGRGFLLEHVGRSAG